MSEPLSPAELTAYYAAHPDALINGEQYIASGKPMGTLDRVLLMSAVTHLIVAEMRTLADELNEPVFRAAIYTGEYDQGFHAGEDAERLRIAALIRARVSAALDQVQP